MTFDDKNKREIGVISIQGCGWGDCGSTAKLVSDLLTSSDQSITIDYLPESQKINLKAMRLTIDEIFTRLRSANDNLVITLIETELGKVIEFNARDQGGGQGGKDISVSGTTPMIVEKQEDEDSRHYTIKLGWKKNPATRIYLGMNQNFELTTFENEDIPLGYTGPDVSDPNWLVTRKFTENAITNAIDEVKKAIPPALGAGQAISISGDKISVKYSSTTSSATSNKQPIELTVSNDQLRLRYDPSKPFSSSATPTNNNHLTNKKYVDEQIKQGGKPTELFDDVGVGLFRANNLEKAVDLGGSLYQNLLGIFTENFDIYHLIFEGWITPDVSGAQPVKYSALITRNEPAMIELVAEPTSYAENTITHASYYLMRSGGEDECFYLSQTFSSTGTNTHTEKLKIARLIVNSFYGNLYHKRQVAL